MLDAMMRRIIDPPLAYCAGRLIPFGVRADHITWAGFAIGMTVIPFLAVNQYGLAILAIVLNRLADGLDGAVARATKPSDAGGFLDIVLDFLFYSAVPFGMALAAPQDNALAAAFLIYSFVGSGSSFLAYAIMAEKRGPQREQNGRKAFFYLGGLTEGTETICVLIAICLFPSAFVYIAVGFGALCWVTTATRITQGLLDFREP